MTGESILVIEDSSAERDFAQGALEDYGFEVVTAANAAAAATYPEVKNVSVIVMDSHLMGISGHEATRLLRQQGATHPIPILLLVPEDQIVSNEGFQAGGANSYLVKPYDSERLAKKVHRLIEEKHLEDLSNQYLTNASDVLMKNLAEKHIKDAVERKTQIIIERCIQNVATAVEQRARAQVDESVTALTAEKEQELVKITVREVAQSMVEKLAERKVTEAMETVLAAESERTVKRIADQIIPSQIRDRMKDTLATTLPREIQTRVQRAVEKEGPEIAKQLFSTVEETAAKVVPRVVRERAPEIIEEKFNLMAAEQVPKIVRENVAQELETQLHKRMEPSIREAQQQLQRKVIIWNSMLALLVIIGLLGMGILVLFGDKMGITN